MIEFYSAQAASAESTRVLVRLQALSCHAGGCDGEALVGLVAKLARRSDDLALDQAMLDAAPTR